MTRISSNLKVNRFYIFYQSSIERGRESVTDCPETARIFSFLQILTAIFGAFAHGGNDVRWEITTGFKLSSLVFTVLGFFSSRRHRRWDGGSYEFRLHFFCLFFCL